MSAHLDDGSTSHALACCRNPGLPIAQIGEPVLAEDAHGRFLQAAHGLAKRLDDLFLERRIGIRLKCHRPGVRNPRKRIDGTGRHRGAVQRVSADLLEL